jgi:SAM-dependent methyltransferase
MRRAEAWVPTKFELRGTRWRASRNRKYVAPSSRIMADRIATAYESALRKYAGGDLLDLGCGNVPLYGVYKERARTVVCADWPGSIHSAGHVDVQLDLNGNLPFKDASFDTVILTDVLEHLPTPARAWSEVSRILRPEGSLIVGVPFLYWIHEHPHDYHRYTEFQLRNFCREHGLQVVELAAYGGPVDVLGDTLTKMLFSRAATRCVVPLLSMAFIVAGRRIATRQSPMPLGYLLVASRTGAATNGTQTDVDSALSA